MSLRDVLEKIVNDRQQVILRDHRQDWDANDLLNTLSPGALKRPVHMLPGVYIAALEESGLMGEVLYRLKAKA